jgi:hypothetical protein
VLLTKLIRFVSESIEEEEDSVKKPKIEVVEEIKHKADEEVGFNLTLVTLKHLRMVEMRVDVGPPPTHVAFVWF